jgi:hypothetical protein
VVRCKKYRTTQDVPATGSLIIVEVPEFGKHNATPNGWVEARQPGKLADGAKISDDKRQPIPHNHHAGL